MIRSHKALTNQNVQLNSYAQHQPVALTVEFNILEFLFINLVSPPAHSTMTGKSAACTNTNIVLATVLT